ncbi:MAG: purine/pyrimidine permease [Gemmatimonadota bacterium]|nr:purine/pyrimidine permease [Gemmatimonadota bacterium]
MSEDATGLVYGIEDRPDSWWETILYGWQHTLVDISPFVLPLAVAAAAGMSATDTARLINFGLFGMGLATLIQTTVGNRLPIIQGPSATLTGTLAPVAAQLGPAAMWGAAFAGGVIEGVTGASRLVGRARRLFPPAVTGVVVLIIGLSLGQLAVRLAVGEGRAIDLALASGVLALVLFLQTRCSNLLGGLVARAAIFVSIWVVGLGVGSVAGQVDWTLVAGRAWIAFPALFPFGGPGFGWEFSIAAVLAVTAGYVGSMVESIGDYAATCDVADEQLTVRHIDRGIAAEGFGSALASVFGGLPCTSYTQNIGIIAATRVASRAVVRVAAVILLLYGLSPKFGALLVALPRSVLGGVFVLVCGMIAMSGLRLIGRSPPRPAIGTAIGLALIIALGLPVYAQYGLGQTWIDGLPVAIRLLVTNSVVLGVLLAVGLHALLVGHDATVASADGNAAGPRDATT